MKWNKLGKIFNPLDYILPNGCAEYAQSPQALEFDDFIRIYFSSRSIDSSGKFLSHIAFVEMSKDLKTVLRVSDKSVISLGELGAFDEHGIFPMNILRDGKEIKAYTTGWNRRVSVSVDTAIGVAQSTDGGLTFSRLGTGPVLAATVSEPCLVGDGFVKKLNGQYHMWYIFGSEWKQFDANSPPDRIYKIAHATSKDGVNWLKDTSHQLIEDSLGPDECQALPTVICIEGRLHMFFCYREAYDFRTSVGRGYRIGHAWSDDFLKWTRDDIVPNLGAGSSGKWDDTMQCYPHVFECDGKIYLLYNGNEFGRFGFGAAELVL